MKKSLFQLHIAVLMWGLTGVLGKLITLSAPVLVWYRMGLTALIIAGIISYQKKWIKIPKVDVKRIWGIGILFAFHWIAFYASIKLANASVALICLSSSGIFVAIFEPIINRTKFNKSELGLGALVILGMLLMYLIKPDEHTISKPMDNFELGLALGLIAAIISTAFTIFNKPFTAKYDAKNLVFHEMLSGWIFISLLAPLYLYFNDTEVLMPQGYEYIYLLILVYFCTVLAQSLCLSALKNLSSFTVAFAVNLEPLYGIILAFIVFKENEQLGLGFYLGMLLIALSVLLQVVTVIVKSKRLKKQHSIIKE